MNPFARRWSAPNGYRRVLDIGLPLMASMISATVTQFTDRMFLGRYSLDALAASLSGSLSNFTLMALFMGIVSYVNVFVAQYTGQGRPERLGAAVWQGVWLALGFGALMALAGPCGGPLFALAGHTPAVQAMETDYFSILCLGSGLNIVAVALSTFYSGRGLTRPVMLVNMTGAALNIPLDYAMINGAWGFPEMGIQGAGWATVISWGLAAVLFVALVLSQRHEARFRTRSAWRPDAALMARLLRFGVPGGLQMFLDVVGFMGFVLMVGRLGTDQLAATNMVLSLNHFTFLPMVGLHIAAETLMGQAMGAGRPGDGAQATLSCLHLCVFFGLLVGAVFILAPGPLLAAFKPSAYTAAQYAPIAETGRVLLMFVVAYTVFDGAAIAFSGGLKGAGDTRFTMLLAGALTVFGLILPVYFVVVVLGLGLFPAWSCLVLYLIIYSGAVWLRFHSGAWKKLRVVEED
ncbi:MATE family efflux transporter [Desulfocurvus sp. DL9XJH121]